MFAHLSFKAFVMQLTFRFAVPALAFFATVQSIPFNKRTQANAPGWDLRSTPFPPIRRGDLVFQYRSEAAKGNVSIADPYNYFETSDGSDFYNSQIGFTNIYLEKLEDLDAMRTAIKNVQVLPVITTPKPFGPKDDPIYLYYFLEAGSKIWISYTAKQRDMDVAAGNNFALLPGKVLIDDSLLGDKVSYKEQISPDGTKVLYSIADTETYGNVKVFVRDVSNPLVDKTQNKEEGGYGHYPDIITNYQAASETWSGDSKSFFYNSIDGSLRYHVLGKDVKDDPVIVKPNSDKDGVWWTQLSDDGQYILLYGQAGSSDGQRIYIASLDQQISGPVKWVSVTADHAFSMELAANIGQDFYFRTGKDAPNLKIARFSLDFSKAIQTDDLNSLTDEVQDVTVVPEDPEAELAHFSSFDTDKIFTVFIKNDAPQFLVFDLKTGARLQELLLGILSTAVDSYADAFGKDLYVSVNSLNTPNQLYYLKWNSDTNKFTSELAYQEKTKFIDPDKYIVERQLAPSKTGNVQVPFYVLHRKGLKLDGSHPVIINFSGAYGYSRSSWFDTYRYAFVRSYDAIYILAAPRGGGESGDYWHKSGQLKNKQNTFDDIISVAQYAIDQKWTSPGKIILNVEFSGVLSAAAIVNQAAEGLIGAFIGVIGIFDLLRSDQSKDKERRAAEYGSPSDPIAFDWLRKYSPLHNINSKKSYPTILIYPPKDDNVAERWQSYKYISELQYELSNNPNPILLGNSTDAREERMATAFALAAHTIGFKRVNE